MEKVHILQGEIDGFSREETIQALNLVATWESGETTLLARVRPGWRVE